MMTRRQLVITADDFGRNESNDDAILECHHQGIITAVSVFTTHDGFHTAAKKLKDLNNLSIGVHLDFTSGRSSLPRQEVSSLVGHSGEFICNVNKQAISEVKPEDLEREFRSQIEMFLTAGLTLGHLDNHRPEIYFYPKFFEVSVKLASQYKVPLRSPFSAALLNRIDAVAKQFGMSTDQLKDLSSASLTMASKYQVKTPAWFSVLNDDLLTHKGMKSWLNDLPMGVSELCTHPGVATERERQDLAFLMSKEFRDSLSALNIQMTSNRCSH